MSIAQDDLSLAGPCRPCGCKRANLPDRLGVRYPFPTVAAAASGPWVEFTFCSQQEGQMIVVQRTQSRNRTFPRHGAVERANQLQVQGHDVIHLEIGEPDFTTAAPIVAAGQAALAAGHTRYTSARGLPQLREAIAGFYAQRYRLSIDPERILITRRLRCAAAGLQPAGGSGQALAAGRSGLSVQPALPDWWKAPRSCAGRPRDALSADP